MTPDAMAALHARCFDSTPPPWSADAFAAILETPGIVRLTDGKAFLLGRLLGPEAEVLTLAVDPNCRRQGLGATLVTRFCTLSQNGDADEIFLEVSRSNRAARALYAAQGFVGTGCRPGYYAGTDALILKRDLRGRSPHTSS